MILLCCCLPKLSTAQQSLDAYILDSINNKFVQIASSSNGLTNPVDLDFYPNQATRPFELWILSQGTYASGGTTVTISNANKATRKYKYVKDGNAYHFMAMANSMAFGDSNWATAQDILDCNRSGGQYTGPTLWSSDMNIYGVIGNPATPDFNGSHLDMIHQAPYGKGIAFEKDNSYWVLDGYEGYLKRFNFSSDHTPGKHDHSDGDVRIYTDFTFTKHDTLPHHIVLDNAKKYLYGCDPIAKKIFRVDITSGNKFGPMAKVNTEALTGYNEWIGLQMKDVVTTGLSKPVGIDIYGDRLVVTDNATKEIIIYNIANNFSEVGRIKLKYAAKPDIMGVKVGPDGQIYFVDKANKKAYMIENKNAWPLRVENVAKSIETVSAYPNPSQGGQLTITGMDNLKSFTFYSMCGAEVLSGTNVANNTLNTAGLLPGMYLLRLNNGTGNSTLKINIL